MAKVYLSCPKCQESLPVHICGDQYKDYYNVADAPAEDVEELDGDDIYCDKCESSFTLVVKIVTKPVAKIGFIRA